MTTTPSTSQPAGTSIATTRRLDHGLVPLRPAEGRALDQPVGLEEPTIDKVIDDAATEIDPVKRKALYATFVKEANTELPVWMPIEQIFVTVITAKARNHSNTPRWGSSSWHDLWLSA
jgi:ABC-type transport system substrate-binding protein